jgi:RNA polymerase sigma factor (sigma-70 family)
MGSSIDTVIWEALQRQMGWIKQRCEKKEFNLQKCEELYQEVLVKVVSESAKMEVKNPDAWIKAVAYNQIADYQKSEASKSIPEDYRKQNERKRGIDITSTQGEVDVILDYMKENFSKRDQIIMDLCFSGEAHKEISEIVGMQVKSLTNTISKLKKQLNEFINRGSDE